MSKSNPKFISLATKNALVYFLLVLAGLSSLGFLLFRNSAKEVIESSEQQVLQAAEVIDIKVVSFINNIRRDVIFLAQSPFLNDFLTDLAPQKKDLLASEYLALLRSKPDYAQIRLIGINNNGMELIRAERLDNQTFRVEENDLQKKGTRNYFAETIGLPKDSVYFSPIDLNKEYGTISVPIMPTMRVACPVFREGKTFGIVIINVNLEAFFKELKVLAGSNFDLKILNQEGHFLIHPDSSKVFTFEFGKPAAFSTDFGLDLKEVFNLFSPHQSFLINEKGLLYAFKPLFYPKPDYQLFAAVGSDEATIMADFYAWRRTSLTITFGLAVMILLIALAYMRRQAKELREITETMTSFPENITPAKLPISRNDEIGQLAKRFEEMSRAISDNLSKLKLAKEKVEQAVQEKDAFLENMSHEIRNPIHSIIGMTHLLEKNNPGRHQKAFIEALKFNSNNLLSLVNDILDYKKLSKGELQLNPDWIHLPQFLQKISNSHQFNAASKKLSLEVETDPSLESYLIKIDPIRLTQIVNNLVINALKFTTENGTVKVSANMTEKEKDKLNIRISVKDTGIGIEKDKVQKIVERYYTQPNSKDEIIPEGAGLGLPIVIQILKLFNSKLNIESTLGEGSTFYFDIQISAKPHQKTHIEITQKAPIQLLKNVEILAIDDDEQTLFLYENLFQNQVRKLSKYSDIQLLKSSNEPKFDIIISDLHFGQNVLFDFVEVLQKNLKETGQLFILSGADTQPNEVQNLPHFAGQFQKPFNPSQLLENLTVAFGAKKFGTPDVQTFWKDYDHDKAKFERAIKLLIKEWEKMAVELTQAVSDSNYPEYTALRHKLITSVRRLKLTNFEKILELPFEEEKPNFPKGFEDEIQNRMVFYIWWLKYKNQTNSTA